MNSIRQLTIRFMDEVHETKSVAVECEITMLRDRYGEDRDGNRGVDEWICDKITDWKVLYTDDDGCDLYLDFHLLRRYDRAKLFDHAVCRARELLG